MNPETLLFSIFAIGAGGGAIAVACSQNVVRMAVWLVVSLASVGGLFFLLHGDFLGAAQLLIYVGGTVVLLIFGVMLTATGPYVRLTTSPLDLALSGGVATILLLVLTFALAGVNWDDVRGRLTGVNREPTWVAPPAVIIGANDHSTGQTRDESATVAAPMRGPDVQPPGRIPPAAVRTTTPIGLALLGIRSDRVPATDEPARLPVAYLLPFEAISVHLLVVLIGAAYLARAKRRLTTPEDPLSPILTDTRQTGDSQ